MLSVSRRTVRQFNECIVIKLKPNNQLIYRKGQYVHCLRVFHGNAQNPSDFYERKKKEHRHYLFTSLLKFSL